MARGLVWTQHPRLIEQRLLGVSREVVEEVAVVAEDVASFMQDYAQGNHPWQNRTGEAERGLTGSVDRAGDRIASVIAHTAPHGIFLELKYAGRDGVLPDTLDAALPYAERELNRVVRGVFRG